MREMSYELPQNRHSLRHTSSWQDVVSKTTVPVAGGTAAGAVVTTPAVTHTHTHTHTAALLKPKSDATDGN